MMFHFRNMLNRPKNLSTKQNRRFENLNICQCSKTATRREGGETLKISENKTKRNKYKQAKGNCIRVLGLVSILPHKSLSILWNIFKLYS